MHGRRAPSAEGRPGPCYASTSGCFGDPFGAGVGAAAPGGHYWVAAKLLAGWVLSAAASL